MAPLPPSRVISSIYPPSSTTAATYQYLNEKALTFASEWYFKPEGVKLVKERFEEELQKRRLEAIHEWVEEDQTFRIRCHPGDVRRIWPLFYQVVANIINDEAGEDDNSSDVSWTASWVEEPFESDLIERLEDYLKRTGQDGTVDDTQTESSEVNFEQINRFPEEFMSFTSKATWPQIEDPKIFLSLNLDSIALDKTIKQLEALTGCRLAKSLKEPKIYIGGQSEKKCTLAISKLDILHKYQSMSTYQKHLFYGEAEEDFKLILKPTVDVKMHYFKTTLLEYLLIGIKCNYPSLPAASTVRIAPYNRAKGLYTSVSKVNINPVVKPEDRDRCLIEWKDFKYCGIGQRPEILQEDATPTEEVSAPLQNVPIPSNHTRAQAVANKEKKDAIIERWVENVAPAAPIRLGHPLQGLGSSLALAYNSGSKNGNENKPSWDSYTGFEGTPVLRHEFKPKQISDGLIRNLSSISARVDAKPSSESQPLVPQLDVSNHVPSPPANGASTAPLQHARTDTSAISSESSAVNVSPAPNSVVINGAVPAAALDEILEAPHRENPAADLPAPRIQVSVGKKFDSIESYLYREPGKSLLDDDISGLLNEPVMQPLKWEPPATATPKTALAGLENQQPLSEAETRVFRNTMNQRAPKPKSNPFVGRLPGLEPAKLTSTTAKSISVVDPVPEFLQEIDESFQDLMKPAQGFRGQVQVQAEFGRVLLHSIHSKHITSKGSTDNTKTSGSLQNLLDSADLTSFIGVLTTSSGEMPHLLTLTDGDGKNLWEKKSPDWTAEYEFFFIDNLAHNPNSRFRVVIDAEGFGTQIKRHRPLGSIYVHGVCRHWDFRVTATGIESGRALEEEFGELTTAVESSLYIPPDSTTPYLFFKLDEAMSKRFELAAARVYRICRYKSKDLNSTLKVSEVHSLDINKTSVPMDGSTNYKLLPGPLERKPCVKPGLGYWFEVSISSPQLDSLLEQNQTLELGEEAKWTPEGLSKLGFGKPIYLRACEMLKQMDGIGQYNNNGVELKAAEVVKERKVIPKPEEDYW